VVEATLKEEVHDGLFRAFLIENKVREFNKEVLLLIISFLFNLP
jgi:hypothetical protein